MAGAALEGTLACVRGETAVRPMTDKDLVPVASSLLAREGERGTGGGAMAAALEPEPLAPRARFRDPPS